MSFGGVLRDTGKEYTLVDDFRTLPAFQIRTDSSQLAMFASS